MGAALLVLALVVGACGPAYALVVVNRSDTTIALLPGMIIPPCSQAGYTAAQIDAAQEAFTTAFMDDDDSWIPDGATQFTRGFEPQRIGAPDPQTVIVSGSAEPRVIDGSVPAEALPDCGGAPLGIS